MRKKSSVFAKQIPKILAVDDKETERLILSRLLSRFDIELHTAASGQEALSMLLRHDYILILLDVHMPTMGGLETAKYIRSNPATENIPVIFLTAFDKDEVDISQAYKLGAIDYLIKPIDEDILSSKVKTFLRSYTFEKEKQFENILTKLERQNNKLKEARREAELSLKEANRARSAERESYKQIEQQTRELLQYTKELEHFTYVATHDLRSPLLNLEGLTKLFRKRGLITQDNREIMERMEASVGRISTTLQDLVEVVAYKKSLNDEIRPIDISYMFNNILQDLEVQIREVGARITSDFSRAPNIDYVPGHLRSILQNLLSNAIKYHSPDRELLISVTSVKVEDTVLLSVKDNGIGIDEKYKEKVFGLFQRLSTETKGKGIGLYVTRSQVEALGGCIDFKSRPGVGTEFTVHLKNQPSKPSYLAN